MDRGARGCATNSGAVLVFDEMKTGFRLAPGGYQETGGVKPDLAAFGKAMANGFPLAAVVGRATSWKRRRRPGSRRRSPVKRCDRAPPAVLQIYERHEDDVCDTLGEIGAGDARASTRRSNASGVDGVTVEGIDPMWLLRFDDPRVERRFLEVAVAEGVLFKRGAYNYAALAHDEEDARRDRARREPALVSSSTNDSE